MTIENRKNSIAMKCDCPHCHMELIRHDESALFQEAKEEKWSISKDYHECYDCVTDNCPGEAIAKQKYGKTSHTVISDNSVLRGEVVFCEGEPVGIAKSTVNAGEPVEASLVAPPDPDRVFSTEDENGIPKPGNFDQAHGNTIPGITETPSREPIRDKARILPTPKRTGPKIKQDKLDEIADIFGEVDDLLGDSRDSGEFN